MSLKFKAQVVPRTIKAKNRINLPGIPQWEPQPTEDPPNIEAKQIGSLFSTSLSHPSNPPLLN
jgi:hypothetical protein